MGKINLTEELLLKMLEEAYEAGWYGTKEMKSECAQDIFDKHKSEYHTIPEPYAFVSTGAATSNFTLGIASPNNVTSEIFGIDSGNTYNVIVTYD